jgi:hypothetical protein
MVEAVYMTMKKLDRKNITDALVSKLKPLDYTHTMWEQGAASFNRVDEWSDIDLILLVDDRRIEDAFQITEKALTALSPIDLKFRLPEPTWHGNSQCFYRLKRANKFLFIDIAVIKKSNKARFLEYSIHEKPVVHFDKAGFIRDETPAIDEHLKTIRKRLETLKVTFPLFQVETIKELNRGNDLEALAFYMGNTFRPLVEILRIKHDPWRYNFHTRYVYYDLPQGIVKKLHGLAYIKDVKSLAKARSQAERWFWQVYRSIKLNDVKKQLTATRV